MDSETVVYYSAMYEKEHIPVRPNEMDESRTLFLNITDSY